MNAKICPKCGCVFRDGRNECHDCESDTRPATEEELLHFEKQNRRVSSRSAAEADDARLKPWQPIAAGILAVYGAVTLLLFGGGFRLLLIFDLIAAVILLVPRLRPFEMLFDRINRGISGASYWYNYRGLRVFLIFSAAFNLWCTYSFLFGGTA